MVTVMASWGIEGFRQLMERYRSVSVNSIEDNLPVLLKYSLNFNEGAEHCFSRPNIFAIGCEFRNKSFL